MSVIDNGEYAGMTLGEYLGLSANEDGEYDFPLLVKYIDARDDLSVQVHPNKTELWYIVEATPDAHLVYGLKEDFDEDKFEDDDALIFNGQEIDLVDIIEQTLDFKIPASVLCEDDCEGLCQGCGANLNIEACSCNESANDEEIIDPRFAKLKDIFKND
jgi:hypothetical protein